MKIILTFLAMLSCEVLLGKDVCLLHVVVFDFDRQPLDGVSVKLVDPGGAVAGEGRTVDGAITFCDFGWGAHTVIARPDGCMPTLIKGIRADLQRSKHVALILNQCEYYSVLPGGCEVMLRVRTVNDLPLPRATVHLGNLRIVADGYGRARGVVSLESQTRVAVESPGYSTHRQTVACEKTKNIEMTVKLTPE